MTMHRGGPVLPPRTFRVVPAVLLAAALSACAGPPGPTALTAVQAKALVDAMPDLVILDVSGAFASGHLPGARPLPLADGSLRAALPTLDRTDTYLVYCRSDASGREGARMLLDEGIDDVFWLKGSYDAWVAAGYPIETSP